MDTTDVSNFTVIDNASISELNKSLDKLFPNPSNDNITIKKPICQKGSYNKTETALKHSFAETLCPINHIRNHYVKFN